MVQGKINTAMENYLSIYGVEKTYGVKTNIYVLDGDKKYALSNDKNVCQVKGQKYTF